MRPLWPPLDVIERELFGPSEALVQQWVENPNSLSEEARNALEADLDAQERREEWLRQEEAVPKQPISAGPLPPPALQDLIRRRVAARSAKFSEVPTAGQILRIDEVVGPKGPLSDWSLARPLAALISEPTNTENVWYGWAVAPETDYASYWDLLLEQPDEPFDPLAGMVQLWNPVQVYIPSISVVLAELKPERLAAVRALALECIAGETPSPNVAQPDPGFVAPRRVGKFQVLTGTPMIDPEEPRSYYQKLYHEAAEAIREPARLAACEEEQQRLAACEEEQQRLAAPISPPTLTIAAISSPSPHLSSRLRHLLVRPVPVPGWLAVASCMFIVVLGVMLMMQITPPSDSSETVMARQVGGTAEFRSVAASLTDQQKEGLTVTEAERELEALVKSVAVARTEEEEMGELVATVGSRLEMQKQLIEPRKIRSIIQASATPGEEAIPLDDWLNAAQESTAPGEEAIPLDDWLNAAIELIRQGRVAEAATVLQEYLKRHPKSKPTAKE